MKHWPPDRSTMQGSRFRWDPSVFRGLTWEDASRSIPRISRDQRLMAAGGCIWLRSVTSLRRQISGHKPRSEPVLPRSKAEGVGFEPTVTLPPQWFSRPSPSATRRALLMVTSLR